ncbi:hypothetical protein [Paenibacillus paridis]|uniref:hypothetical protein n=1 Tax=Paenibacillus paridis TaxID=2583376 RepID=UPI001EE433D9|nr:hypothetical protein [Paenibacillus paridis]
MNKKRSKKITVGEERYAYVISPATKGQLALTVEHEEVKGQKIRVYLKSEINEFWVEFPYVEDLNLKLLKPSEISLIIEDALSRGWTPKSKGPMITYNLDENS